MFTEPNHEKSRILDRIRELSILSLFTIVIAAISIVVMDIIIFPITLFAINQKSKFNFIIKDILVYIILILLIFFLLRKIYKLYKDGLGFKEIIKYLISRPIYYISTFFLFLVLSLIIIFILYILLSKNYFFIYYFTN